MNRYKCPACGGNQYTACSTSEKCIYCGYKGQLMKMEMLEPKESEVVEMKEEKIRISAVDRCVMCDNPVPEGQQVCGLCKHKIKLEETIACKYYVPAWAGNKNPELLEGN